MKKTFLTLIILLFISSCERTSDNNLNVSDIKNNSLFEKITKLDNTLEQEIVATSLNPNEIHKLWLAKIDNYLDNNIVTTDQKNFLEKLKRDLKPSLFVANSEYRNSFDFSQREIEAKKVFGENEGYYFLTKVENINQRIEKIKNNETNNREAEPDPVIEACNCVKSSECSRIVGIGLDGISWENGTCNAGTCYRKSFLWWESDNNRICVY